MDAEGRMQYVLAPHHGFDASREALFSHEYDPSGVSADDEYDQFERNLRVRIRKALNRNEERRNQKAIANSLFHSLDQIHEKLEALYKEEQDVLRRRSFTVLHVHRSMCDAKLHSLTEQIKALQLQYNHTFHMYNAARKVIESTL